MTTWDDILKAAAVDLEQQQTPQPTLHVGPNMYRALVDAGHPPELLTLITPLPRWSYPTLSNGTVRPRAGG